MLGRLFGNASSSSGFASYPRDSVVDEEYTRGLLYPDLAGTQDVQSPASHVGSARMGEFDDWSGLELDALKDFRIMVAQDSLGDSEEPCILFDTHPIRQPESPTDLAHRATSLHNASHRRGASTVSNLKSPTSPLFFKPHQRMSSNGSPATFSVRNRSSTFSGASDEPDMRHQRSYDSKEETKTILNCAFGSSAGASSGTKMHVLSLGSIAQGAPVTPTSPSVGGNMSNGYFRKREPLSRAHTSAFARPPMHERSQSSSGAKPKVNDAILITKLFSVNLPEPADLRSSDPSKGVKDDAEVANQQENHVPSAPAKGKKPRAKKTPVFAVILVVHLPPNISNFTRPPSRGSLYTPTYASVRSFQSSFNSHSSSPQVGLFATPIDRGDARVNALVEHWDIIDRTLATLEEVSTPKILDRLKQVDSFSAALVSKPSKPKEKTMQRTNQINIYLSPLTLADDSALKDSATQAIQRIRRALRIPRVTIGQGRWGLWNDELIRIVRCYGGKEQNFFILNLLTSFLGAHTEDWMTLLRPSWYHGRRSVRQKTNTSDTINTRTVIVSNDRSIARRLIFLLSSFLAGDNSQPENYGGIYGGLGSPVSLRNAILQSPAFELSTRTHRRESPERHQVDDLDQFQGGLHTSRNSRRKPSDVRSIRSIPVPTSDPSISRSSAATTSTVTPNPTTPVPHFFSGSGPDADYLPDESNATASLNKIWRNANKDGESSTASTKWGSLLSSFWSKESSASASASEAPSASSSVRAKKGTALEEMVKEVRPIENSGLSAQTGAAASAVENPASESLPVKLQVNADEGVIDVDIAIPGFLSSSNDSGFASPHSRSVRHVPSVASFDSLASPRRHVSPKGGNRLQSRVAGFLPKFHPDYSLQAVKASKSELPDLIEDIKNAMLTEPCSPDSTSSDWVNVSTTLVANVQTASVKRIRLKRKVSPLSDRHDYSHKAGPPGTEQATAPRSIKHSANSSRDFITEEAFSYDMVMDVDPLLTDAVDYILSRDSNHGSRSLSPVPASHSRKASTGTNDIRRRNNRHSTLHVSRSPDRLSRGLSDSVVVGALEDVVKSVNHNLTEEQNGEDPEVYQNEQSAAQLKNAQDNALREGVKSWLLKAEYAPVW